MEAGIARSSAAIVQRVPADAVEAFRQWQHDVTAVARTFAGFQGTDVYPPSSGESDEWVTAIHFRDEQALQQWLDSPERAGWVEKLRVLIGDFEVRRPGGGLSFWFPDLGGAAGDPPTPGWKMVLTVLLALYPTVLLLTVVVSPWTSPLGFSVSMLIGNALSVALLQWVVVPPLMRGLRPWLAANSTRTRRLSYAGAGAIVGLLIALALLCRPVLG